MSEKNHTVPLVALRRFQDSSGQLSGPYEDRAGGAMFMPGAELMATPTRAKALIEGKLCGARVEEPVEDEEPVVKKVSPPASKKKTPRKATQK